MVAIKSCKNDFGYNDTVCNNLNSPEFKEENIEVSIELNHYNVYVTLIGKGNKNVFPSKLMNAF